MHYQRLRIHGSTDSVRPTVEARFWSQVDKSGDCWLWEGYVRPEGYGQFAASKTATVYAHRFAFEDSAGPIPDGLVIDHRCHVRACVRPSHLRVVTQKQNMENLSDAALVGASGIRGVSWNKTTRTWNAQVTHNNKGHFGGRFATREEAAEAARQLRLSLFTHNDQDRKTA